MRRHGKASTAGASSAGANRLGRFGLALACALAPLAFLGISAPAAWAAPTHVFEKSFGSFSGSSGVAVDQSTNAVYVADMNVGEVHKFDAEGSAASGWALSGQPEGPVSPYGLAVDQSNGDLWVASFGNGTVQKFDREGHFLLSVSAAALPSEDLPFSPTGLATDSAGNLYVANYERGAIEKFNEEGEFQEELGQGNLSSTNAVAVDASGHIYATRNSSELVELDSSGGCVNSCQAIDSEGTVGVGIDPETGHVYAADQGHLAEYDGSNALIDKFGSGHVGYPVGLATDGESGKVYVGDLFGSTASIFGSQANVEPPVISNLQVSSITGETAHFSATINPGGSGPGYETTYSFECCGGLHGPRTVPGDGSDHAVEDDASGLPPASPITVTLRARNEGGETSAEAHFETSPVPPSAVIATDTPIGDEGMTVRGAVNRRNSHVTDCHFEYGLTSAYGHSVPCAGVNEVQELRLFPEGGQFKLSFGGQSTGDIAYNASTSAIQTALESLSSIGAGNVAVTTAAASYELHITFVGALGERDVEQIAFESGTEPFVGYEEIKTLAPGFESGVAFLNAQTGKQATRGHEVSVRLSGLSPGATYHSRLLASTDGGPEASEDGTFEVQSPYEAPASCPNEALREEQHLTFLPDCRAYEMVSPPGKRGGDVTVKGERVRVAEDGSAASFISLQAFGDAVGTGVSTEYMSLRSSNPNPGTNGWSTHAITPPQEAQGVNTLLGGGGEPAYVGDFSPDLNSGIFKSWSPVTNAPGVAATMNLYLRDDLRSPGAGHYQLLNACPLCEATGEPLPAAQAELYPQYVGASADFHRVLFEYANNLTADTPAQPNEECTDHTNQYACVSHVYEWENGAVHLAGYIPPGEETICGGAGPACVPAPVSFAGGGESSLPNRHAISDDGSRVFFGDGTTAELYMRIDNEVTVQLNVSERTDCAEDPTCGGDNEPDPAPAPYSGAFFASASSDGSRVFFTSEQALTDDARVTYGQKLYMYDTTKPPSDPHNLTLVSVDKEHGDGEDANVETFIGSSPNGASVYFTANGQLVKGAPRGSRNIYAWHNGRVFYIGQTSFANLASTRVHSETRMAPNGRYLIFPVGGGRGGNSLPTGYDQGEFTEIYLFDAETHRLSCVTCQPAGRTTTSGSLEGETESGGSGVGWHSNHAISNDGRYVFFNTTEALVPRDTNGKTDAYEYETTTGAVHLLSSGTDPFDSYFMEATPSGSDVLIDTRQRLAGWDVDSNRDLYDVRVNGGFPEPTPVPAACEGDTCQGSSGERSQQLGPSQFEGPSNPPIERHHHRRHHRRKHRHRHRAARSAKRAANDNRRAGR